jgi:hypothetical protein
MFARPLLSVLAFGITIVGLLQFFNSGEYFTFVLGMASYFLLTISGSICKRMGK